MKLPIDFVQASVATLGVLAVLASTGDAAAQERPGSAALPAPLCDAVGPLYGPTLASPLDELRRVAEISGCIPEDDRLIRRGGAPAIPLNGLHRFGARVLPASLLAVDRTAYPDDRNNGALWEGVGVSSALRAGLQLRAAFITLSLQPELLYQENRDFDVRLTERIGYSEFASPYYITIDLPQRFGSESEWRIVPGDSYARIDVGWAAAGVSTESLWRGPAMRYPILMSNTAGGFPHVFVGTSRGVDVFVGRLSGELVWGRLAESDYFDEIDDNDESGLVNVAFAFEPRWLTGLSLGVTRSFQYEGESDGIQMLLDMFGIDNTGNRDYNELASVFGRWVFESSGAEVYAEWGRDDAFGEWAEFLQEPEHSQAFMLGLQKVTALTPRFALRVHGELVHLQEKGEARTNSRPLTIFYLHHQVRQGYTHRGQLLGAGVGPGGDAQYLAVDALFGDASVGAYFERVRRNEWTADALAIRRWSPYEHDAEFIGGLRGMLLRGPLSFSAAVSRTYRYNRDFREDDRGWRTELRLGWSPRLEVTR